MAEGDPLRDVSGKGPVAAFFGALAVGVAGFGGLVLPKLAAGGSSGAGKLEAQVVVVRKEQPAGPSERPCPRHEPPGPWPTV